MSSCRQDFLNVQVTDNLFNFITASFSEMIGWVKRFSLDFDSRVFVERFTYRHNRIKIFICHRKRLRFWYVQTGHYIREKLIKCLTELLITGYGFTIINEVNFSPFDEFWVNNCGTVLEKLLLSVIFVKIFSIRYLSVFQEFFTEVSLSAPGFFCYYRFDFSEIYISKYKSLHDGFGRLFCHEESFISTNVPLFYRDMAIKYIENNAFLHTKIISIRSSCNHIRSEFGNYIRSEFGITEILIIAIGNHLWF